MYKTENKANLCGYKKMEYLLLKTSIYTRAIARAPKLQLRVQFSNFATNNKATKDLKIFQATWFYCSDIFGNLKKLPVYHQKLSKIR